MKSIEVSFFLADVTTLAILRGIQGIGCAAMPPAGVSQLLFNIQFHILISSKIQIGILAHAFPPSRARSLAFATFSSGSALGAATGNFIGGTLTEFTQYEFSFAFYFFCFHKSVRSRKTWRSSFYMLTGLLFTILLSGLYSIDPDLPSQETDKRVDWIGAFLVTTGLVLIVFVFGQGEVAPRQWATPCTC